MLLTIDSLIKSYPTPEGATDSLVLNGISFELAAGENQAVAGPSGSGKSTLLNIIGTLDRPTSGKVFLKNRNLAELPVAQLAAIRNREIGFVFQQHHLLPQCSVRENVLIPVVPYGPPPDSEPSEERAARLLQRVGLERYANYRPFQLSVGQCQRVAVVRALINRPRLLLADEPTGSLDTESASTLADLLLDLNREEGVAMIVVTHAEGLAARMQRQYLLRGGSLTGSAG